MENPADSGPPTEGLTNEQLIALHGFMVSAAKKLCWNRSVDAEDVAQAASMKMLAYSRRNPQAFFDDETRLRAFAYAIVKNTVLEMMRYDLRRKSRETNVAVSMDAFMTDQSHGLDIDLRAAIEAMPSSESEVIKLLLDGSSAEEIAEFLGVSRFTVRARLARARQTLRNAIEGGIAAQPRRTEQPETLDQPFPDPDPEMDAIELYLDPGDASEGEVRAVLRALNNLHKASGGIGLDFHIDGTFVFARQGVPA